MFCVFDALPARPQGTAKRMQEYLRISLCFLHLERDLQIAHALNRKRFGLERADKAISAHYTVKHG